VTSLIVGDDGRPRCAWVGHDAEYQRYHDDEWGAPLHGDRPLFEKLSLEGFQAGLSWITILRRRETFRLAFRDFDIDAVAAFDERDVERLMADPGIIRNRLKIAATIQNAKMFLKVREEFGSFDAYLWRFVDGKPIVNRRKSMQEVPAKTEISDAMSKDLLKRGFKFVGSTICYANMQAIGMVNDHLVTCFRHGKVS